MVPVWSDWAIFCSLSYFLKPLATIKLSKYPTFLGNFCICVKIYYFSSEINFYRHLAIFFWSHWVVPTHLFTLDRTSWCTLPLPTVWPVVEEINCQMFAKPLKLLRYGHISCLYLYEKGHQPFCLRFSLKNLLEDCTKQTGKQSVANLINILHS